MTASNSENHSYLFQFSDRHLGPSTEDQLQMLKTLGFSNLDQMADAIIPTNISIKKELNLDIGLSEAELLKRAKTLAGMNTLNRSFIGLGYYDTFTPPPIQRNILENPGWYTAYTPYQAEISQGRMEALLNFQTMIIDLTKMDIANASLLDEGTAAAEAMAMCFSHQGHKVGSKFFIDQNCFAQTIDVVKTRAQALGVSVVIEDATKYKFNEPLIGALFQYPTASGEVRDMSALVTKVKSTGALTVVAADLLALCMLQAPGSFGADIAVGTTQRFGVPMMFGGPHAAYLATKDALKRIAPGRFIGVSKDAAGNPALRMALQTREQHIRREKATSNICTAQVLLAVMASMYAVYHGPKGLRAIAESVNQRANQLASGLKQLGFDLFHQNFFDTLKIKSGAKTDAIYQKALQMGINLYRVDAQTLQVSIDETKTLGDINDMLTAFGATNIAATDKVKPTSIPPALLRAVDYLTHPVFNSYHTETELMRYIHRLETKDLTLNTSMIPLGSCTMKLNAAVELMPVSWPEFAGMHPFAPIDQTQGYQTLIRELCQDLAEITGFAAVSLQPNAGSQGEYAGLLVIKKYLESKGQGQRNVCLIPASAHGTNPASAVMAGMQVVVVACDDHGNVDVSDLKIKAEQFRSNLAALMITYPSTHGVFEQSITEICSIIHQQGGQVYMDGANMNAMVGLCQPGKFGADVLHLNLHKTFSIPHGGGGPGIGPIGVAAHLIEFLPNHPVINSAGPKNGIGAISAAPWGSAGILPISWSYIKMMGRHGLKRASQVAILNANYVAKKLSQEYAVLYRDKKGFIAHECIIDFRPFKKTASIEVDDVAKRLMDYGFHAPTMSFPVPGTLMIEPTESESKKELDRFCTAMLEIRREIANIENGEWSKENNLLKNAPHSLTAITADQWDRPYSRQKAAFPANWLSHEYKYWPTVSRVDNAYGDRNFVCSCPPVEDYR